MHSSDKPLQRQYCKMSPTRHRCDSAVSLTACKLTRSLLHLDYYSHASCLVTACSRRCTGGVCRTATRKCNMQSSTLPDATTAGPLDIEGLLDACLQCCTSFKPAQFSLDAHADAFLKERKISADTDCAFVRQVLYGTVRYQALLTCFVKAFYHKNSGSVLRGDIQLYQIYAYLAILRLTELGVNQFRRIATVADPQKMMVFLKFVNDPSTMLESCRDAWLSLYDKEYVDDLLATLTSFQPELQGLLQHLEDQVHLTAQASAAEAAKFTGGTKSQSIGKHTMPEPFNLTQPKPKLLPIEEPLPPPIKSQPAPAPHQGPTREERAIEAAKQRNKQQQLQRFSDPAHGPFHLRTLERPTNTQQLKQQQEEELAKQLTLSPGKARAAPAPPAAHVRLNAAAILREDTLYKKKQLQEAQMIKRFEAELRDSSEHDARQREAEAADLTAKADAVRKRRDEMAAAQEAAIQARQHLVLENLKAGHELKEQSESDKARLKAELEADLEANRKQREKIQAEKAKVEAALEMLEVENRARAEAIRQDQAAAARARAEAAAAETAKKKDLILQLRALEKVPRKGKMFDPAENGGHNLLEEMSLLELRQRLAYTQQRLLEEEEQQRAEIAEKKREREDMLARKAGNVTSIRRIAAAQAQARRQLAKQQQTAAAQQAQAHVEEQAVQLHDKLEAKRAAAHAEKARLAAEEKRIRFEQQQQGAAASQVEETSFASLVAGQARELIHRQRSTKQEAQQYEATKNKAQAVRMKAVKNDLRAKKDFIKTYDESMKQLRVVDGQNQTQDLLRRKGMVNSQKDFEQRLQQTHREKSYKPGSSTEGPAAAILKQLSLGVLASEVSGISQTQ